MISCDELTFYVEDKRFSDPPGGQWTMYLSVFVKDQYVFNKSKGKPWHMTLLCNCLYNDVTFKYSIGIKNNLSCCFPFLVYHLDSSGCFTIYQTTSQQQDCNFGDKIVT